MQEKHQQQKDAARSIAIMQGKKNDKLSLHGKKIQPGKRFFIFMSLPVC